MKTIIRIEHSKQGLGLFRAIDNCGNAIIRKLPFYSSLSAKHSNFPTPDDDIGIERYPEENEYCAFKSIEQLKQWIESEWFNTIIELGFKILLLDVIDCVEGEYQILYKKENVIQTKDISNLFITTH